MSESKNQIIRILITVLLGLFVLFASAFMAIIGSAFIPESFGFIAEIPFLTHSGMLVLSTLIIWFLAKGKLSDYGFKKPIDADLARIIMLAVSVGIIVALFRSFLAGGWGGSAEDSFSIQIIIGIWLYASIAEEVLTRGLVQGHLKPLTEQGLTISSTRISVPVLIGALFFALMHIAMVTLGVDLVSVAATVISAFFVGIIAGYYCEKTGSLAPAILVHMLFNMTGSLVLFLSGLL
jgi:membrane protease YdiL (CAAX protease family)